MPIFGLGKKKSGVSAPPRQLPGGGDPVTAALLDAANARDLPLLLGTLAEYTGKDLSTLVHKTANGAGGGYAWLRSAPGLKPAEPLTALLLGAMAVKAAWEVRSDARAHLVSREQFDGFHELLREAEEHLYRAIEADASAVAPWSQLVLTARGLSAGQDVLRRRFEAAIERCPGDVIAHIQMLQGLCRKWGGSHEEMHEFAKQAAHGPHGTELARLVPEAHLEQWLSLGGGAAGREYMSGSKVRADLDEAAKLSIFRADYADPRYPYTVANAFAMAFGLARMHYQARKAFEVTDGVVVELPWRYLKSDPVEAYSTLRARAVAAG
jgi:hypothetical protein